MDASDTLLRPRWRASAAALTRVWPAAASGATVIRFDSSVSQPVRPGADCVSTWLASARLSCLPLSVMRPPLPAPAACEQVAGHGHRLAVQLDLAGMAGMRAGVQHAAGSDLRALALGHDGAALFRQGRGLDQALVVHRRAQHGLRRRHRLRSIGLRGLAIAGQRVQRGFIDLHAERAVADARQRDRLPVAMAMVPPGACTFPGCPPARRPGR